MRWNRWTSCVWLAGFAAFCAPAVYGQTTVRAAETPAFGTSSRIQTHIGFKEFAPLLSTTPYSFSGSSAFTGLVTFSSAQLLAHPHIPTGARLTSFELDFCDNDPTQHLDLELLDCDFLGGNCMTLGHIFTTTSGCGFIVQDVTGMNYTMQNNFRQLYLNLFMHSGTTTNVLLGAFVGYTLQVSPGPATATFTDVPTTSPQFKFVEALVAAGITAGCGGGNFCPGQPVTRGQMAVFLATALGLHFPN